MQREIARLGAETFDLLIVGGGVYGAALAIEGAARGARVALLEQGDFVGGASSNSLKILHGGFRYLQQANMARMRSSIRARREWSLLAPELVKPLGCVIASEGFTTRSTPALTSALILNDLISADRNAGVDERAQVPRGHMLNAAELRATAFPATGRAETAGCLWWDLLALDTEALVMRLIARATANGVVVANYVRATSLLVGAARVHGVTATDGETGASFEIRASRTVCATGSTRNPLLEALPAGGKGAESRGWCWAANVVLNRKWHSDSALALSEPAGSRQLFFVPWRDRTMVGTHYVPRDDQQDEAQLRRLAVMELIGMAQAAAPGLGITENDVAFVHWGRLPLDGPSRAGTQPRLATAPALVDYGHHTGLTGLWSVNGVKFTTAREVARGVLPRILQGLVMRSMAPQAMRFGMLAPLVAAGTLEHVQAAGEHAARDWLARSLDDAVLRRTGLGSAGYPGREALEACARGMAGVLGWSGVRIDDEIEKTMTLYRERHFWKGQE